MPLKTPRTCTCILSWSKIIFEKQITFPQWKEDHASSSTTAQGPISTDLTVGALCDRAISLVISLRFYSTGVRPMKSWPNWHWTFTLLSSLEQRQFSVMETMSVVFIFHGRRAHTHSSCQQYNWSASATTAPWERTAKTPWLPNMLLLVLERSSRLMRARNMLNQLVSSWISQSAF